MIKINFQRIGDWFVEGVKTNGGLLVGGASMIALALICKKLNIPYQVLTDPFCDISSYDRPRVVPKRDNSVDLYIVPNNPIEAAMNSIYCNGLNCTFDGDRYNAAKEIYSILVKHKDDASDSTKTYAITLLQNLGKKMTFDGDRTRIMKLISQIGKGEL